MAKTKEEVVTQEIVEPSKIIQDWLTDPKSAFAFLFSYLQKDPKNNLFTKIDSSISSESTVINSWGIAIHNLEHLYSAIKDYASIAPETEYILVLGFNDIFESALKTTEKLAEELIIDILRDETGRNTTIRYGSGSAWANEQGIIVRVAQKLFELQEIKQKWEEAKELKKQRQSE